MPQSGQQQLEALQKDLACPNCEYNLRGLYGDIVNCPECGEEILVPQLQKLRLSEKWKEVPGYATLVIPGIVIAVILMVLTIRYNFRGTLQYYPGQKFTILIVCEVLSVIWLIMMGRVWYVFRSVRIIPLIIITHIIWIVGILGVFACLFGSLYLILCLLHTDYIHAGITAVVLGVIAILFWLVNKIEIWVKHQCICLYNTQNAS